MRRTHAFAVALSLVFAVLAVLGLRGLANVPDAKSDQSVEAVRAVIEAQAAAWNRGDIEGYMDGYERSDQTLFISGDNLTRGWQTVLERYRKNYDSREKMGTLAFSDLEFKPLSPFYMLVAGRWQLTRAADTPHGRFTLLFRRTAKGWRIVHDHTSAAAK